MKNNSLILLLHAPASGKQIGLTYRYSLILLVNKVSNKLENVYLLVSVIANSLFPVNMFNFGMFKTDQNDLQGVSKKLDWVFAHLFGPQRSK